MRVPQAFHLAIFATSASLALGGCTAEKSYESVRGWARAQCERIMSDPDRAECLRRAEDDYETFEDKRKEATRDAPPKTGGT